MHRLDLAELLTRWRPIDGSLWPDVVTRCRAGLEAAVTEATRQPDGPQ